MKGVLLDNWTLEKIVKCMNDKETPFSPEVIALIEILVLWDNIYYCENDFSSYWQNNSVIDGFDMKEVLKPIPNRNLSSVVQKAEFEYYQKFCEKYTSVVAKRALEYMYIAKNVDLSYMPFDSRAKFVRENNLYFDFKQYYDRYDAIHAIDSDVMKYYDSINDTIRKADISFNPNILFSIINRNSSSFIHMVETAKKWAKDPSVKAFKNWVSKLEDDVSHFRTLKIKIYESELREIEQNIISSIKKNEGCISFGIPFSISIAMSFPVSSSDSHLVFPMSLYLEGISDDSMLPARKYMPLNNNISRKPLNGKYKY